MTKSHPECPVWTRLRPVFGMQLWNHNVANNCKKRDPLVRVWVIFSPLYKDQVIQLWFWVVFMSGSRFWLTTSFIWCHLLTLYPFKVLSTFWIIYTQRTENDFSLYFATFVAWISKKWNKDWFYHQMMTIFPIFGFILAQNWA